MSFSSEKQTSSEQALRFLEKIGVFTRRRGNTLFLSRHRILDDIASDLADGLDPNYAPEQKLVIYVGIHLIFGPDIWRRGFRVGIQTEHYYDERGTFIARRKWEIPRILRNVARFDAILEISPGNRPIYDALPPRDRAKVIFGPHIFPRTAPNFVGHKDRRAVFFGTLSNRRREVLEALDQSKFLKLSSGHFGSDLVSAVKEYAAIANIHFDAGLYTEAPRVLLALKTGKPLVSEELSSEWEPHIHYIPITAFDETMDLKPVYEAMARRCCEEFGFQNYLERVLCRE